MRDIVFEKAKGRGETSWSWETTASDFSSINSSEGRIGKLLWYKN